MSFCDCAGLGALIRALERARAEGRTLTFRAESGGPRLAWLLTLARTSLISQDQATTTPAAECPVTVS